MQSRILAFVGACAQLLLGQPEYTSDADHRTVWIRRVTQNHRAGGDLDRLSDLAQIRRPPQMHHRWGICVVGFMSCSPNVLSLNYLEL